MMTCLKITESQNGQIYPKDTFSHGAAHIYCYCVDIVHDRAMAIRVIALNRDVSSMSHCMEIISHSFSIFVVC